MAWGFSIGLLFFICQIFFFGALNVTKNHGLASMVNYSQVLFSFLVEIIFYDEVPTLVQGIGVVGIIFGLGLVLLK
jgi:drug/metabolite transporter (DMT)-like permease